MNDVTYRIYSSHNGWKPIGIKDEIIEVIKLLELHIAKEEHAQYIIVEHHYIEDMDISFKNIYGIEDFLKFKEEYKPKSLKKGLIR